MKRIDAYTVQEDDGSIWTIKEKGRKVWWKEESGVGPLIVSFDRKKSYNLWTDYPDKFTDEELKIFEKEEKYWTRYFGWRKK